MICHSGSGIFANQFHSLKYNNIGKNGEAALERALSVNWALTQATGPVSFNSLQDHKRLSFVPGLEDNASIRYSVLCVCARFGHLVPVKHLLRQLQEQQPNAYASESTRKDITEAKNRSLRWAARNGHFDIVAVLLADPKVASDPKTGDPTKEMAALMWAARRGHNKTVSLLLTVPNICRYAVPYEFKD